MLLLSTNTMNNQGGMISYPAMGPDALKDLYPMSEEMSDGDITTSSDDEEIDTSDLLPCSQCGTPFPLDNYWVDVPDVGVMCVEPESTCPCFENLEYKKASPIFSTTMTQRLFRNYAKGHQYIYMDIVTKYKHQLDYALCYATLAEMGDVGKMDTKIRARVRAFLGRLERSDPVIKGDAE